MGYSCSCPHLLPISGYRDGLCSGKLHLQYMLTTCKQHAARVVPSGYAMITPQGACALFENVRLLIVVANVHVASWLFSIVLMN